MLLQSNCDPTERRCCYGIPEEWQLSNHQTVHLSWCKCFTCVTKTIPNLATYSRKPENYNGSIIFGFDIMKNSFPINFNLCQTWLFHLLFGCLFWFDLLWTEIKVLWVQQKRSAMLVLTWQKIWILNWVGMSFSWCQYQK